jgi:hypothetical protein
MTQQMPASDLRRNLLLLTEQLKKQQADYEKKSAEQSDHMKSFYNGVAGGVQITLSALHSWTNGEFGEAS